MSDRTKDTGGGWMERELLEAFYVVISDYRAGALDEAAFRERLFMLLERYERMTGRSPSRENQKALF